MLFLDLADAPVPGARPVGDPNNAWWVPAFIGGIVVIGLVVYFGAKFIRRSQGVDIDLVYRELPPE